MLTWTRSILKPVYSEHHSECVYSEHHSEPVYSEHHSEPVYSEHHSEVVNTGVWFIKVHWMFIKGLSGVDRFWQTEIFTHPSNW